MTTPSFATIYKWTDEKGSTNYTDDIKNVPEQYQEKAKDFDKIEQEGSITYDPEFGVTKKQKSNKEPYYKRFLRELEEESEERAKADKKKKVILYMTDWWPACLQAKSYFVKKGIEFTEVNVEKDRNGQQEMLKKSGGYRGIPLIDINGTILRGFNQRAVDQALNR